MKEAVVVGASGYSGEELCALLAGHPSVKLVAVTSRQHAGKRLDQVLPRLRGQVNDVVVLPADAGTLLTIQADVYFLALPHMTAADYAAPLVEKGHLVIDLSADFRFRSPSAYEAAYGHPHAHPHLLERAVYGLPELRRPEIVGTRLIACPGCYPTSVQLPLAPLLRRGLIGNTGIVASSLSGVTGAGRKAEIPLLFSECDENARPYGLPRHRHLAEIEQELSAHAGSEVQLTFVPHLIPIRRGILSTIYAESQAPIGEIRDALFAAYQHEPFVRVLDAPPEVCNVSRTNFCDIFAQSDGRKLIVMSAIDNLTKGAAGQAVQCMNLALGFNETEGLL